MLPTVGTGTPGRAAITDIDGDGKVAIAIFGDDRAGDAARSPTARRRSARSRACRARSRSTSRSRLPDGLPATAGSPDAPFFGALGAGAFGDITGDGLPEYVAPTGGLRKLLDVVAPAQQGQLPDADSFVEDGVLAHHQLTAWNPRTGALVPAFPRPMDDMQFIGSPALADVDGDGVAEAINGSGAYLLRAYRADGASPRAGRSSRTAGTSARATPGDVDGDGLIEIVAITREGKLYVWDTPGAGDRSGVCRGRASAATDATPRTASRASRAWRAGRRPARGPGLGARVDPGRLAALVEHARTRPTRRCSAGSPAPFLIPTDARPASRQSHEFGTARTAARNRVGPPAAAASDRRARRRSTTRFVAAVRATLVREIAAANCAQADMVCRKNVMLASFFLTTGDGQVGADPRAAVFFWATGIARF